MKRLDQMTYQELVELERQVKQYKVICKDRKNKDVTRMIMKDSFGNALYTRLCDQGAGVFEGDNNYVVWHKVDEVYKAVNLICDMTMENYKIFERYNVKRKDSDGRSVSYTKPYCNGYTIDSRDNDEYEQMVKEISDIIRSHMNIEEET